VTGLASLTASQLSMAVEMISWLFRVQVGHVRVLAASCAPTTLLAYSLRSATGGALCAAAWAGHASASCSWAKPRAVSPGAERACRRRQYCTVGLAACSCNAELHEMAGFLEHLGDNTLITCVDLELVV